MVKEFNTYMKLSISIGDFEYIVEDNVKRALNNTILKLKDIADITETSLSEEDIDEIKLIFETIIDDRCTSSCSHYSLDTYFGDQSRFDVDAPYKNFSEFSQSPLLDQFWANFFRLPLGGKNAYVLLLYFNNLEKFIS